MYFNGDGTPDNSVESEDPYKVAAQEMQATTAVLAQQKTELATSGVANVAMMGSVPSPEVLMKAMGQTTKDPYAGLVRDEKIALIEQLKKSQAQQPVEQEVEIVKAEVAEAPAITVEDQRLLKSEVTTNDISFSDIETYIQKSTVISKSPPTATDILNFFLSKSVANEGARGGKIVGHRKNGLPIYESSLKEGEKLPGTADTANSFVHEEDSKGVLHVKNVKGIYNIQNVKGKFVVHFKDNKTQKESVIGSADSLESVKKMIKQHGSESMKKAEGQGAMPAAGDPPSSMPMSMRTVDGESLEGVGNPTGPQSPPATTMASVTGIDEDEEEDDLQKKTPKDEDLMETADGSAMKKARGNFIDWNQAADDGQLLKAQLISQLLNRSEDVYFGIGVKPAQHVPVVEQPKMPNVYFQKGGAYVYVDSEDQIIEKALNRANALTFTQGGQVNLGAPVQHEASCPHCNSLVKSYLYSCTECGVPLRGTIRAEAQGLLLSKSVSSTLIPNEDEDIKIG